MFYRKKQELFYFAIDSFIKQIYYVIGIYNICRFKLIFNWIFTIPMHGAQCIEISIRRKESGSNGLLTK